ncbi:MAG: hypothetical protein AAGD10_11835 [Myxococcota bacterium]
MLNFLSLLIWLIVGYGLVRGGLALGRARRRALGWLSAEELRTLEGHAARIEGPLAQGLRARASVQPRADRRLRLLVDRSLRALSAQELDRREIRELLAAHTQRDLDEGTPMRRAEELRNLQAREAELAERSRSVVAKLESLAIGLLAEGNPGELDGTLAELEAACAYVKAREELTALTRGDS